jgi:hypothetical protein
MDGLFCANFGFSRGPYPPCKKVWCGSCYRPRTLVKFHVNEPEDEDGFAWIKKGGAGRFRVARNGDNIITLFQCDLCVFRNGIKREPTEAYPTVWRCVCINL